jgi:DNA-binding NarL/FixJ family response regulator
MNRTPSKILIVDDHPLVREGLAARIERQPDMELCGECDEVDDALRLVKTAHPNLVIIDISLKSGHGIDLIKQIHARDAKVKMLILSAYDESLYAERALRAGALGYLNKQETREKIVDAIRTVLAGDRYLSPVMTQRLVDKAVGGRDIAASPFDALSDRELEVFELIGKGVSTSAIASQLHLSPHTIDTHREKIKTKLYLKNAAELQREANQWVLENG